MRADAKSRTPIALEAIAMSCGRIPLACQSSSQAQWMVLILEIFSSLARLFRATSISLEKSMAVTDWTLVAIGMAKVPGPEPTSSTDMVGSSGRRARKRSMYEALLFRAANELALASHSFGPLFRQPFFSKALALSSAQSISV